MSRRLAAAMLLAVAAISFWLASAIHFGARIPLGFVIVFDPFKGAAPPEAILGFLVALDAIYLVVAGRPRRWLAAGGAIFAILVTLFGLSITVTSGRTADVAYHIGVLIVLAVAVTLLLAWRQVSLTSGGTPAAFGKLPREGSSESRS